MKLLRLFRKAAIRLIQKVRFTRQFRALTKAERNTRKRFQFSKKDLFPMLGDATEKTEFDRHYVYHTAWAARVLRKTKPKLHVDISSSLYFNAIVSAYQRVDFYDYRPPDLKLTNLNTRTCDILGLPFADKTVKSLSCMHVVEHIGLGRYGDSLDYDGDLKAIRELKRVVAPAGDLLFAVPIGAPTIKFNAHRIYSYDQVIDYFSGFHLREFALIPDSELDGGLVYRAPREFANKQDYGCGCFWFQRRRKRI